MMLAFLGAGVLGIPVVAGPAISFEVLPDVDIVRVMRGLDGAFLADSGVEMARCKALWVRVVALTWCNLVDAVRGGSRDNIW